MFTQYDEYSLFLQEKLGLAKNNVAARLENVSNLQPKLLKKIVSTYVAAIEPNLMQWLLRAHQNAKTPDGNRATLSFLEEKIVQNERKLLLDFAKNCNAEITENDYLLVSKDVSDIWREFADEDNLIDMTFITTLENLAPIYIPYLRKIAMRLSSTELGYVNFHEKNGYKLAQILHEGLLSEMLVYKAPSAIATLTINKTQKFLEGILVVYH